MSALPRFDAPGQGVEDASQRPLRAISILVCALGGEGGGVLTEWLVESAIRAGFPVQSTSIPGVAQRTGATTYYIEIFPVMHGALAGPRPVLSLYPVPGCLDVIVSSELLETVRQISLGMSSPERTHIITSSSRTLTTTERMHQADGRLESARLQEVVAGHSLVPRIFDMDAVAKRNQTVVSAVMFGALAASGVLPFTREVCEAVIRLDGKNAERSLAGFSEAFSAFAQAPAPGAAGHRQQALPVPEAGRAPALDDFPTEVRGIVALGYQRLCDYQDEAYAELYLTRLRAVLKAERAADQEGVHGLAATLEMARYLALWMAFDDIVRVADLKARRSRALRVHREIKAKPGELVQIHDYFKPGLPEFAALLPQAVAARLRSIDRRRVLRGQEALSFPLKIASRSVFGLVALRLLASLRWLRRRGSRFQDEQGLIEKWLAAVRLSLSLDWQVGYEVASCGRLIKGYGTTNERGKENLLHVIDHLAPQQALLVGSLEGRAAAIKQVREAALADDAGMAFDRALQQHGAPARPLKEQPIRFMRRPAQGQEMLVEEAARR
jgi:indolepyruvate ferredoxin oxidoreductase beta subunit